jgi:hypothetical protein
MIYNINKLSYLASISEADLSVEQTDLVFIQLVQT